MKRHRWAPLIVLGISLTATLAVSWYVWDGASQRDELRFESRASQAALVFERRMDAYIDMLYGAAGLFAAEGTVSADQFERYVAALQVEDRYPGVQGIGYTARVPAGSRDSLNAAQRAAGFEQFEAWPVSDASEFHSIVHLLPQDERNRVAMGYDMWSDPVRREAMREARDTGGPAASGKVTLVQEIDEDIQPGFLIYLPVYAGSEPPEDEEERRQRLRGFVYSPFRLGDLLAGLQGPRAPVELAVYDGSAAREASLLFDSRGEEALPAGPPPRMKRVFGVDVAGRRWTVEVTSGPNFEEASDRWLAALSLLLGLPASAVLFLLTASEARAHRRADEAVVRLRVSETQYRMAFENNPSPVWVFDPATMEFLEVNAAAEAHYGYSRDEFLSMSVLEIRPREEAEDFQTYVNTTQGTATRRATWKHQRRDGSIITVEISSNSLEFAGRDARLVLVRDITEERRAQEALEHARARMARILRMSAAVTYTMELTEGVWSPAWITQNLERVTGYESVEGLEQGWWEARIHPDDRDLVHRGRQKLLQEGAQSLEYRFRHADGHHIWVRDDAVVRFDDAGAPVEIVGSWLDVSDRRQLEDQFRQAQRMEAIGRLAGSVAHDFNNLLTIIRSQSDLLLLDIPSGPLKEEVAIIQETADRGAALSNQLLSFSRGQFLVRSVVDAKTVVEELAPLLRRALGAGVRLVVELPETLPTVEIDAGQLEQALMNLTINARDAMPDGGTLEIEGGVEVLADGAGTGSPTGDDLSPGEYLVLRVSDTGAGIDEPIRTRIFEPFYTTKGHGRGSGLGLATVYGFVRQSGGTVRVHSELGVGTRFELWFPASGRPVGRSEPEEVTAAVGDISGRVLLIEDDANVRRAAKRILERGGLSVVDVGDAEAGLEALAAETFRLVLTDLVLPGMSGREFAHEVSQQAPSIRVVIMSGYEEETAGIQADLPPGTAFIKKPFTVDGLLEAARVALGA